MYDYNGGSQNFRMKGTLNFGTVNINSADLFFVERFPLWEVQSVYFVGIIILGLYISCVLCREVSSLGARFKVYTL